MIVMLISGQHCYSQIDSLSYQVYSAYLASLYPLYVRTLDDDTSEKKTDSDNIHNVIISWKTGGLAPWGKRDSTKKVADNTLTKIYPKLSDETIMDFMTKVDLRNDIENKFVNVPMSVIIADDRISQTLNNGDKTSYLYKELINAHGGLLTLSNVGFNKIKNQAIIYVVHYVGEFSAGGDFIILEKDGGKWKVVKTINLWRS